MKRDAWSGDERALFEALQELMAREFPEISQETARGVFETLLEEWSQATQEGKAAVWNTRITQSVATPLLATPMFASEPEVVPSVEITVDSRERIEGILEQVLQVGAVLVELDPPPPLNDLVAVRINFPEAHLTVETQGRVVHQSKTGTAIEVSSLTREDRLALEAIRADLAEKEAEEALEKGTLEGMPSVKDSILEPGVIPPVQEADPAHSFAPFSSRRKRRLVSTTMTRRKVDLATPDMDVVESSVRSGIKRGETREFYGPPPQWYSPEGDPERVEELAGERVLDVLLQISGNGMSGLVMFRNEEVEEQYLVDSGYVVERAVKPRFAEEELGPMLKAADRITKRQLAMAAAHADEFNMTVARSLLDLDILSPEELRNAIAGRLTFFLKEFCDQAGGTVEIYDAQALPAGFLPQPPLRVHVAVERVIFDRLFRELVQLSGPKRESSMEEEIDSYPEILAHERDRLERAIQSEEQRRLVDRVINGRRRLREVLTESPLSPAETFAVVYSLHRMGLLRFDRSLHATVVRERLRENVTVKYLSVHKASYFEVLNVHWSSYGEVIEKAYQDLIKQFDPAIIPDELEEEVHQRVAEINERVEAAYVTLARRETRHGYRTRIMPEYKLAHAIPLFLKQSELAERRGQWEEARDGLRRVLEIDPDQNDAARRLNRIEEILKGGLSPDPADTNH